MIRWSRSTASRPGHGALTAAQAAAWIALLVLVVTPNLWLASRSVGIIVNGDPAVDWNQYVEAASRFWNGGALFAWTGSYGYHYSPLLAPVFGALAPLGTLGWRAIHVVAALALPSWPMRLIALVSWPFWFDVEAGNVLIFVVLAAAWALRGSRLASLIYLVLVILVPRPLMIPVAAWLLWRQPSLRTPFVALFMAHGLAVVVGGWADAWLSALLLASHDVLSPVNVGPSRFIGAWWLVIGVPIAGWLTVRGRLGWASLCASPYWLPYYLLMPLLEIAGAEREREVPSTGISPTSSVVSMPSTPARHPAD